MHAFLVALVVSASIWPGQGAAKAPFTATSFDAAVAQAATEKKLVLVDFFTTWCAPCKALDRETWTDGAVRAWLAEQTVSIKIDAEKEVDLARRYRIDSYPTILLLKSDGTEVDRYGGFRAPDEFLADARESVAGRDALTRARAKLAGDGARDPEARMDYGRALAQRGLSKEALDEYLWCFDKGAEADPAFVGVRASYLLEDIVALGRQYPPALDALRQRRDAAERLLLKGTEDWSTVADFGALNRELGEEQRTLAVFDTLGSTGEGAARTRHYLFSFVFDALLSAKRYADIGAFGIDLPASVDEEIANFAEMKEAFAGRPEGADILASLKGFHVRSAAKYYEVLIGLGKLDLAASAEKKLVAFDTSGATYAVLVESAARAGKPDVAKALVAKAFASLAEAERQPVRAAAARLGLGTSK